MAWELEAERGGSDRARRVLERVREEGLGVGAEGGRGRRGREEALVMILLWVGKMVDAVGRGCVWIIEEREGAFDDTLCRILGWCRGGRYWMSRILLGGAENDGKRGTLTETWSGWIRGQLWTQAAWGLSCWR